MYRNIKRGQKPPFKSIIIRLNYREALRFFAFHNHFTLVKELSLVPVSAMEHMWLASCRAGAYVWCCCRVVRTTFTCTRFTLPVFRMCHLGIITSSSMRPTEGPKVFRFLLLIHSVCNQAC